MATLRASYFFLIDHPLLLLAAAMVFCAAAGRLVSPQAFVWRLGIRLALAVSAGMFLVFGALYFSRPGFLDHVEAQVATVAALKLHGGVVYHAFDGTKAYAIGYGPALYAAVATAYRVFGEGLQVAKLPALFAVVGGLSALFATVRTLPGGAPLAWRMVALAVALGLVPFAAQFWTRADPLLYGCVAIGLLTTLLSRGWQAGVLAGVLIGIAMNLKLHGGVYFLPVLAALCSRHGWGVLVCAALPAIALVGAPFLPWSIHGAVLWGALKVNAGHGISFASFIQNLEWAVLFAAPAIAAFAWRRNTGPAFPREVRFAFFALILGYLLVSTVAAKPGAGNWHLLPLVPATLWLAARCLGPITRPSTGSIPAHVVFAWCGVVAFLGWTRHDDWVTYLWRNDAASQASELRAVVEAHRNSPVIMGAGGEVYGEGYRATFVRPILAFASQPYSIDPVAIMDLRKAGRADEVCASLRMLGDDPRVLVIIPHGEEPFAMGSYYGAAPCFPESFRTDFSKNFQRIAEGRWFDTWGRRDASAAKRPVSSP
jgi:hypothetical protein